MLPWPPGYATATNDGMLCNRGQWKEEMKTTWIDTKSKKAAVEGEDWVIVVRDG